MAGDRLPIGYTVRIAIVRKVGRTFIDCDFYDRFGEKTVRCPIPHPYVSRGSGMFVGIEPDTFVLLANSSHEKWYVVGFIPDIAFYNDVEGRGDINFNEIDYPSLDSGEITIRGSEGQKIELLNNGSLMLDAGIGRDTSDLELSKFSQGMFLRVNNFYQFTEAGRIVEGVIKRDLNLEEKIEDSQTSDFLTSSSYDSFLSTVGRSPSHETHYRTTTLLKSVIRNPALVEKKELVYEYADSFNVKNMDNEANAMASNSSGNVNGNILDIQSDSSARDRRRTDTLNLQHENYNHLIEKVQGTLVDIYGNVLDINRNIIPVPDVETINTTTELQAGLKKIYKYLRRSVKYHFEINSRKPEDLTSITNISTNNNEIARSKWAVDVDGEGLTKINIPASSEIGNIPVLGRYINSQDINDPTNGSFKDKDRRDIWLSQFGSKKIENGIETDKFSGQTISDTAYIPKTIEDKEKRDGAVIQSQVVTAGTAYHDLFNIANSIFTNGKLKSPDPDNSKISVPPINASINNKIFNEEDNISADQQPNAGGRSISMNLDGSMEMSVGADTIDRKSMVIDTAGGVISHFGRDKNGRSIIHQTDGDVIVQIGGKGISGDTRFKDQIDTEDRPGRIEIHLNRPGGTSQKIIIDENGLTLNIQGNMVMTSSGDFVISADGSLLLNGELIKHYGSHDPDTRAIIASEKLERRKGRSN
jgi:hypothetical protein